jgi:hypothetical protein
MKNDEHGNLVIRGGSDNDNLISGTRFSIIKNGAFWTVEDLGQLWGGENKPPELKCSPLFIKRLEASVKDRLDRQSDEPIVPTYPEPLQFHPEVYQLEIKK